MFHTKRLLTAFVALLGLAGPALATTTIFQDDFEDGNLDGWTVTGRRINGTWHAEVIDYSATSSKVAWLYKKGFSEVVLQKEFKFNRTILFEWDMANALSRGDARSSAAVQFLDASGTVLGYTTYIMTGHSPYLNASDTYYPLRVTDGTMSSYALGVQEALDYLNIEEAAITSVMLDYRAYSRWNGPHYHQLWLDNVRVTGELYGAVPEPATMLAGLAGLAGVGRYVRRRKLTR